MHFLHLFRLWIPVRCAGKYKRLSPTATGYFILSSFSLHIYYPWKTPYWFLPCFWKTCKQSDSLPPSLLQWDHLYNKLCPQPRRLIYLSRCTQEVFTLSFLHFPLWPPLRQVLSFLLFFWTVPQPARPKAKTSTIPADNILLGFIRVPSSCWEIPSP